MDSPLISVCMPVYNAQRFVGKAVESILNQTLGNFEFLILDDGSADGSLEILRDYARRDSRICLRNRGNKGLVTSLNEMIDIARGEFIARMDGDDIAMPDRFQRQVDFLRTHPECVLLGSRVRLIDEDGDPLCEWCTMEEHESIDSFYLQGECGTAMSHPSIMMRRDAVLAIGKYRPFESIEDIDLFLRLAEYGRIANTPEVLLEYRVHATNLSSSVSYHKMVERDYAEMIRDARRRRDLPELPNPPKAEPILPDAEPLPLRTEQDEIAKLAWWALGSGYVHTARKHARRRWPAHRSLAILGGLCTAHSADIDDSPSVHLGSSVMACRRRLMLPGCLRSARERTQFQHATTGPLHSNIRNHLGLLLCCDERKEGSHFFERPIHLIFAPRL